MKSQRFLAGAVAITMAGCQTLAPDTPARIVAADATSRAELQEIVNAALGTNVMLADDALTKSNVLLIELTPPRTISSQHPQGRIMEQPMRFQLVTNHDRCYLIDERNQKRHELTRTTCTAIG